MSLLISRLERPELFTDEERPISDIVNAVESVYAEISTKSEGYNQQELLKALRESGLNSYEVNTAISILFQTKKILSIIG
jgi:hypothetical protein